MKPLEPYLTLHSDGDRLTIRATCSCGWEGQTHQAAAVEDAPRATAEAVEEGRAHLSAAHPELFAVR